MDYPKECLYCEKKLETEEDVQEHIFEKGCDDIQTQLDVDMAKASFVQRDLSENL